MTPNKDWQKIEEIFKQVILLPVDERISFAARLCGEDSDLHAQVSSLLSAYNESDEIFEQPVFPIVARLLDEHDDYVLKKTDIGAYKIKKVLGKGGVGAVYLAEDGRLERSVAIKTLSSSMTENPENVMRFRQEAKAASAISHQNVAHIYEFITAQGKYFLAMEYVAGKTLRELINEKQVDLRGAIEIALQISYALDAAHKENIIHRDIKPENIMVTESGLVKVLDFGLAKIVEKKRKKETSSIESVPGLVMGTTAYMSPEQARGNSVDERTDLWSLGVVLYEMITGVRPFDGDTPSDTQAAVLLTEPQSLGLSDELLILKRILQKTLTKDVSSRYQTAKEITEDLRLLQRDVYDYVQWSKKQKAVETERLKSKSLTRGATRIVSNSNITLKKKKVLILTAISLSLLLLIAVIALQQTQSVKVDISQTFSVLPLIPENTSPDTVTAAEKLSQDLTSSLRRITDGEVLPYNTAAFYNLTGVDLKGEANTLNAQKVITGTVNIGENRKVDLHLQIRNTHADDVIWEKLYSYRPQDSSSAQYQIALDVAEELFNRDQNLKATIKTNQETLRLYLLARQHLALNTTEDYEKAVGNFKQVTIRDVTFTDAYSGLAIAHILHGLNLYYSFGLSASRESFPMAFEAAEKALQLDPNSDEALTARAFINYRYKYNWTAAEADFKQAITLNPNNFMARHWYGEFLHKAGRADEGFAQQKAALELEPHSVQILEEIEIGYYLARRFDKAVSYGKDALLIEKNNATQLYNISEIYEQKGDYKAAAAAWKQAMIIEVANPKWVVALEESTKKNGRRGLARAKVGWLESLIENDYVYPTDLAKSYAVLGEKDKAFEWLNKGIEERAPDMLSIACSPAFDSLRSDERFQTILKKMKFSPINTSVLI